ncbi:MAG: hypothetical protein EXS68_00540 [Candidatus Ryanbacteria bacterium]|nr:hypothetical protein [Candidatus Ryanbacteria bacterium]
MSTFSRLFMNAAVVTLSFVVGTFSYAQTSGTEPLLNVPSGELAGTVHIQVLTLAAIPGPIGLFLAPPQIFLGALVRSTSNPLKWEYEWDTTQTPNGAYQLIARTQTGTEVSRPVIIHNATQSGTGSDATTQPPPPPTTSGNTIPPPPTIALPPPPPPTTSQPIVVELSQTGVVREALYITLSVENVNNIEIFLGKLSESEGRPIGKAERTPTNPNLWRFRLDTTKYDNGLYSVGAKIQSNGSSFWTKIDEITILNAVPPPPPTPSTVIAPLSPKPILKQPTHESTLPTKQEPPAQYTQPLTETEKDAIKRRIRDDVSAITQTTEAIDNRPRENAELPDSDGDGITDYDEKNIYKTNPVLKDSDKDGINDSIELLSNQDPNNATAATITYQSPKEAGTPRPEILAVADIIPLLITEPSGAQTVDKITLTGKAPPHSLVTLYIFSTPFVVTVQTNADGQWVYVFDKELADGEHAIYATITDSKGSVLAKSNPLPFIKTANAITKTPSLVKTTEVKPSIYGKHPTSFIIALIASTIGIAFIVIGLVVRRKRAEAVLPPQ